MTGNTLKPWTRTPFELLSHAEGHRRGGTDFDKRVALVGFDNSIEVSVITYLGLNPIQRGGRSFERAKIEHWKRNFHTKLEFLEEHAQASAVTMEIGRAELVYYHELRNDLYHAGNGFVPAEEHLEAIRRAAVWTFSTLFDCDADEILHAYFRLEPQVSSGPAPDVQPEVPRSEITTFLRAFLTAKKTVDTFLELHGSRSDSSDLLEAVQVASRGDMSNDIPSSPDLIDALAQADHVKNLILQGEAPDSDSANLESLSEMLDALAGSLKPKLREHHQEIALRALQATLKAKNADGRAGVVMQTVGSGLSLSLMAYLALCRKHPALGALRFVVVTETHAMMDQFLYAYHDLLDSEERRPLIKVQSGEEFSAALVANPGALIATTGQKLLKIPSVLQDQCVVVGYNLRSMLTKRASAFPKGIFILFTSTYPPEQSGIPATFGKIIRDYAYNEAKSDGYLLPVRIIRMIVAHALSPETGLGDLGYVNKRSLSAWETESIARAVIQDMTVSHRASANKAIVFVPDIASGFSIVAAIEHLQLGDAGRANDDLAVRAHLISSWTDSETQESSLLDFRNSDVSSVAVMTTARVIGLDFPEVDRCYVTRPIPPSICNAIVSIVGRLHLGKTEGVVVDFGENSWPILASE